MFHSFKSILFLPLLFSITTITAYPQTTVDIGVGYRRDTIQWDLQPDKCHEYYPTFDMDNRVLLEDIDIVVLSGKFRAMDCFYYFRAGGDYGWICHGKSTERLQMKWPEVLQDPCKRRSSNKIDDDYVVDVQAVLGYPIFWGYNCYMFAPWIGYGYNAQKINVDYRKKFFNIDKEWDEHLLDILPLKLKGKSQIEYLFRWYGPMLGIDAAISLEQCWTLYGEFAWHFASEVKRKRDHDVRLRFKKHYIDEHVKKELEDDIEEDDLFDDIDKTRNGWGFSYEVGANYFTSCWYIGVKTGYKYLKSDTKRRDNLWLRSWELQGVIGCVF